MADSGFMGLPGGNPGGGQNAVPTTGGGAAPAIGSSQSNPLVPGYPTGSSAPNLQFPAYGFTGSTTPQSQLSALEGMNVSGFTTPQPGAQGGPSQGWYNSVVGGLAKTGVPKAIGGLIAEFLANGAGFNPQAVQSMLAALQPQIAQGNANIMESFGAEGLGSSSPAALGLAGFQAQATLNEGQIISQMYEQSVQNYMNVLMSTDKKQQGGGLGSLIGGAGSLLQGGSSLFDSLDAATAPAAAAGGASSAGTVAADALTALL